MKRIGIVNGGGDCPGLNAVIEAVVKYGTAKNLEIYGFIEGSEGMLDTPRYMELNPDIVDDISATGGTILHTTNHGKFSAKKGAGEVAEIPAEVLSDAAANLNELEVEALIVIGGDGTLTGAMQLAEHGVKIVGVPKTIDNDLCLTDRSFGFSSAVEYVSNSLDRLHTTADSHSRVFVVETMGRHAGWISLYGGIAGNADVILIPELPFTYSRVLNHLREKSAAGQNYFIIVTAEGARPETATKSYSHQEAEKENRFGGAADRLAEELIHLADKGEFEIRVSVLGHLQRGGPPNAEDRVLAQQFGVAAVDALLAGEFGKMIALNGESTYLVDISEACKCLNLVEPNNPILKTARSIGILI